MSLNLDKVPTNLDEAVTLLVASLTEKDREEIRKVDAVQAHFGLGMYLRNNWSMWDRTTPLSLWFQKNLGLVHGDDLSGIILDALWAEVNGRPRNTEKLVKRYHLHWRTAGFDPATMEPL